MARWSQDRYVATIRYAALAHHGQLITGTDLPYLVHISLVAMEVSAALIADATRDGDLALGCALLHDVLEDTPVSHGEIVQHFGAPIAQGVLALTKDLGLAKEQQMRDSLQRIQMQPYEVWMVKLADRICNLQPPPAHWDQQRVLRYRDEAQLIHDTLGAASPFLAERLRAKIAAYPYATQ